MTPGALAELHRDETSRKRFLRMLGGGTAAAGLAGLLAACGEKSEPEPAPTATAGQGDPKEKPDVAILNYALTLEFLEAAFYREATASGELKTAKVLELAKGFGATEQEHVDALIATVKRLGGTPVKAPKTVFGPVFEGGEEMIVMTAGTIENVGAAAYLGAAPMIEDADVLAAALSIHSVEARHAAALNQLADRPFRGGGDLQGSLPDGAFAKPLSMQQVMDQVKPFIGS